MAATTVSLGYAVWAGGSGNLSSANWITGYVENGTTFVNWVDTAPPATGDLEFETDFNALVASDPQTGVGGTLTGSFTTTGNLGYAVTTNEYLLSGQLSVHGADIAAGTFGVGGTGADLTVTDILNVGNGGAAVLAINDAGSVAVTNSVSIGLGTITVSGTGSALTEGGDLVIGLGTSGGHLAISDGGSVLLTGTQTGSSIGFSGGSGTVTVDGVGSTLNSGADLTLYNGIVMVSGGASLSAASVTLLTSSSTVTVTDSGSNLNSGNILSVDAGSLTIANGAAASAKDLVEIGAGTAPATLNVEGPGSSLTTSGLFLGGAGGTATGSGTLDVTNGGTVILNTSFATFSGLGNGSELSVDATSAMEFGGSSHLTTGMIVIDPGELLFLTGPGNGTVNGAIENNGSVGNGNNTNVGTITLTGPVTGTGVLQVIANLSGTTKLPGVSDLVLDGAVGAGQTAQFTGASGTLSIGDITNFAGTVQGFQQGDTIDLLGVAANSRVFNAGTLILSEIINAVSTTVGTLYFNGISADQTFQLSSDGGTGTDITINAAVLTATPSIFAPGTATVGVGQANPITGITIGEQPTTTGEIFTVVLADTNGVLAANTVATGGGGSVTPSNGGKTLTISGSLDQVNADLSTLTDDDASTASDTITINATDSNDGTATPAAIVVTVNGVPQIAAPTSVTLQQNKATAVSGFSISETGNTTTSNETFTVVLTDTAGVFAADISAPSGGGGITPSTDGKSLTIIGSLAQVNADLTTLTDNAGKAPSDSITLSVTDSFGNKASKSVPVTNGTSSGPAPTVTIVNAGTVERSQSTVIGTVAPGIAGDLLTLFQTSGAGTLRLGDVRSDGTQQIIYTAPASVPGSKVDTVGYTITDSDDGATAGPPPASVQLDAGPSLKAKAPTTIEQGQTTVIGTVTPGLKGDSLTLLVTHSSGGTVTLNNKGQIVYTAPVTSVSKDYTVSYTISDQYKDATVGGQATLVVDGGPTITPEPPSVLNQGQTTDIGLVTPGLPGDTLTLKQTAGRGKLTLGPLLPNGTRQVIYTAPALVSSSAVDKVSYTITDQHKDDTATGSSSVQLNPLGTVTGPVGGNGNIKLGNGNSTVNLSGSNNVVSLGAGNSKVSGGQNANTVSAGNGNTTVSLAGSTNTVTSGNGNATVTIGGSGNTVSLGNGNASVTIGGGSNKVTVGSGNSTISLGGGGNTVTTGNGNETITLGGSASTVTLGTGNATVHGGLGDTIKLSTTSLTLYGTNEMVFVGAGNATVNDFSTGLTLKIGPTAGADVLTNFASDPGSVVDLLGGVGGFSTTAAVLVALKSDGHGGTLLSFGAGGSLDFAGVAKAQLHAANFKIG